MSDIAAVLTQNIFPIFIVAAFGFALRRWLALNTRALSSAVLNCLGPCLVFSSLVNSQLPGDELLRLSLFTVVSILSIGLLAWLVARALRFSRQDTAALLLVVMFVNSGNYGLTLVQLRYGEAGLARAVIFFTASTLLLYTLGVFVASMGSLSWRATLSRMARLPAVYAAVAAVIVYSLELTVPAPLMSAIEVAGAGAIPVLLLVLGMQMADLNSGAHWRLAVPAVGLRLVVSPFVAVGLATLLGLEGLGRSTSIVEAVMPPAIFTAVLATEFDLQPPVVTSIVILTTLLSPLTVAATITYFGL